MQRIKGRNEKGIKTDMTVHIQLQRNKTPRTRQKGRKHDGFR